MTGVAPFALTYIAVQLSGLVDVAAGVLGLVLGLAFCVTGYAGFFVLFIAGNAPDVTLIDVAMRGVGWGLLQGALAAIVARS